MPLDAHLQHDSVTDLQREMIRIIGAHSSGNGVQPTEIAELSLLRSNEVGECEPCTYEPALAFVVQGAKQVRFGDRETFYGPLDSIACNVPMPVSGRFVSASEQEPYLGLKISLNPEDVTSLLLEADEHPSQLRSQDKFNELCCGLGKARMDRKMQVAVLRLLFLLDSPEDIPVLAPLMLREILYRALNSDLGPRLRKFAAIDSQANRISRAITTLQLDYDQPLRIASLAAEVNMSESSFYHTFKKVTRMSPLQFQKKLRLQEARRLMLAEALDAASASFRVGYESPSQFSREYSRMYGAPPKEDVSKWRGQATVMEI